MEVTGVTGTFSAAVKLAPELVLYSKPVLDPTYMVAGGFLATARVPEVPAVWPSAVQDAPLVVLW
jgi:hypothetical protein